MVLVNELMKTKSQNKTFGLLLAVSASAFSIFYFLLSTFYPAYADSGANVGTVFTAVSPTVTLTQNNYNWYANSDALAPGDSLTTAENTATSTPASGTVLRLRMNILDNGVDLGAGATFKLQYANSTSGSWTDMGTSTAWTFYDNTSVADGQIIVTTILSDSNMGESYGESNPSAAMPSPILQGQIGEWDWVIANSSADTASNWFFRMIYSSSTALDYYSNYPKLTAVEAPAPPTPPSTPPGSVGVGAGPMPPPPKKPTTTLPIPPPLVPPPMQCIDFNGDNRVDIIDLSILLYHYGETGPYLGCLDLNRNGVIDFPDISILMYYWTS